VTAASAAPPRGRALVRRGLLAFSLVGLALLTALVPSPLEAAVTVALGGAVALAAGSERTSSAVSGWSALAVAVYAGAHWSALRTLEGVVGALAVSAVLVGIAVGTARLRRQLLGAEALGEVARAKLARSNRELRRAIDETGAALGTLAAVVDNLADGLVAVRRDGRTEIRNGALSQILGADDAGLPPGLQGVVDTCLGTGVMATEDLAVGERSAVAVASPIRQGGELWGAVVLVRDVTLEREIDRMKSNFIATVSHEMRTPLTSILGFARISRDRLESRVYPHVATDDPKVRKVMDTVQSNLDIVVGESQRLSTLIGDVLDISKIESGQMEWSLAPRAPADLVGRAVAATAGLFPDEGPLVLVSEVVPELQPVLADADRVLQVLVNLVGNAAKFTESGEVRIAASPAVGFVEFRVSDTGVGIAPADQAKIFERFKQVGDTLTDRPSGTGLGLPICREIVHHHGGRIWVESDVGRGSSFAFTLPLADTEIPEVGR